MAEKKEEKKIKESRINGNSLGASGFTLGILSILSFGIIGMIMSIIGFIFCFIQQKKKPTKLGRAGLIINVAGFILSLVYIIYFAPMLAQYLQTIKTA